MHFLHVPSVRCSTNEDVSFTKLPTRLQVGRTSQNRQLFFREAIVSFRTIHSFKMAFRIFNAGVNAKM